MRRERIVLRLACAALALALVTAAHAGKSPGGTVPGGTIHFLQMQGGVRTDWKMKGDGGSKAPSAEGTPTYSLHGGARWFLVRRETGLADPDGSPHLELFAATEDGRKIQLTDDPLVEPPYYEQPWGKDDSFFSFVGSPTDASGAHALYRVAVDWSSGSPVAGTPEPVLALDVLDVYAEMDLHDWSPDGRRFVYPRRLDVAGTRELIVCDMETLLTTSLGAGNQPSWALNGIDIAFSREGDIWKCRPDGQGLMKLTSNSSWKSAYCPRWSPDGRHLAYTLTTRKTSPKDYFYYTYTHDVMRIAADGGGPSNLTGDVAAAASAVAWR